MSTRPQDPYSSYEDQSGHGMGGGGMQFAMPRLTPVVKVLILANAVAFGFLFLLPFDTAQRITEFLGLSPGAWKEFAPLFPVWQLLTYGFLHSVHDPFHVLGNMLFLYFLGTMLEGIVGGRRFLVTYVTALLVAGIAMLTVGLIFGENAVTVGASGAVLAVVVAVAVLRPTTRIIFIIFPLTLKTFALIYVGFDVFRMLNSFKGVDTNVAYPAHLAGALFGFLAARRGWLWQDPLEQVERWRETRAQEQDVADEERLDELLAKISKNGINSLSTREKAFLKRKSKRP